MTDVFQIPCHHEIRIFSKCNYCIKVVTDSKEVYLPDLHVGSIHSVPTQWWYDWVWISSLNNACPQIDNQSRVEFNVCPNKVGMDTRSLYILYICQDCTKNNNFFNLCVRSKVSWGNQAHSFHNCQSMSNWPHMFKYRALSPRPQINIQITMEQGLPVGIPHSAWSDNVMIKLWVTNQKRGTEQNAGWRCW